MAARHKRSRKASGGEVKKAGGNPYVFEDAGERKRGGKAVAMSGHAGKRRLDRPGRKRGGRVGADTAPLSSAHKSASASIAND